MQKFEIVEMKTSFTAPEPEAGAAVIGAACRLPGANSARELWQLLTEGRNSVSARPRGRWSIERFLRPGNPEPGFAYTFAGGYLDNPLAFDPAPFGISPREAQQMDPQQRLLLEVTWEALEDAGIPPSTLAGRNVGVYVGASMVDYQGTASHDPAVMESHFMTGNSLSILSNRISYVFDFKGPSFTVDSACSSSFVGLKQAIDALAEGRIELAVVGGVNLLLSPVPFIGFSQARMLSPTGLSRPFSAKADGYVRSEGAVVLVLQRSAEADSLGRRVRGYVVGASVNSDGRTTGISLPSLEGQKALLERFYAGAGISPDDLAFVEAHGTGTKVGDPIEATAIGHALGQKRSKPLPIGSIKSNIGHLEAASGLAGLLKSLMALEHRELPKSLFLEETNDAIDFSALNLKPNDASLPLDLARDGDYAGICNYGFGGTNAHVLVRAARKRPEQQLQRRKARHLVVSAADSGALTQLAGAVRDAVASGVSPNAISAALGHGRDLLPHRFVVPMSGREHLSTAVEALAAGEHEGETFAAGVARNGASPVVFVFSGNGSQFSEMGHSAYAGDAGFRAQIAAIDALFEPLAGWSIIDKLRAPIEAEELQKTSVSQPLIYAIQSALVGCLAEVGIRPAATIGHSVGEVAAAEASGILSRADAVRLIYLRSKHQEGVRGLGRMMVVATDSTQVEQLLAGFGEPGIEIAATNSATSTTLSGEAETLKAFARHCRKARVATIALDIDYPFHCSKLDPLREAMLADLAFLKASPGTVPYYSAVTGEKVPGESLEAEYWWRNIREPVRFQQALETVADASGKIYVEISPRAILTGPIAENLRDKGVEGTTLPSLSQKETADPVGLTIARLIAHGADFDREVVCGEAVEGVDLPGYPFQRQSFALPDTPEALNAFGKLNLSARRHPLLGARMADGSPEWRNLIDPVIVPYLDDHRVDGGVIVPAAGLIEIALAAARDLFGDKPFELDDFDVLKALAIAQDEIRELSTRFAESTDTIEIWSRKRFSASEWLLHARGKIGIATGQPPAPLAPPVPECTVNDTPRQVYEQATLAGLDYGPMFQLVTANARDDVTAHSQLATPDPEGLGAFADLHILNPISLDAAFHGLFISRPQKEGERKAHLPTRFRKVCVWRPGATVRSSITLLTHETDRFKTVAINLFDADDQIVATVEAAVLRALYLGKATLADRTFRLETFPLSPPTAPTLAPAIQAFLKAAPDAEIPPAWMVTRAFSVSLAHRLLGGVFGTAQIDIDGAIASGMIAANSRAPLEAALVVLDGVELVQDNHVVPDCPLPAPEEILAALTNGFPEANLEIRLAASALSHAPRLLASGGRLNVPASFADQIEANGMLTRGAVEALREAISTLAHAVGRKPRIVAVQPWSAGLLKALTPLVQAGTVELTLAMPDRKSIDTARAQGRLDPEIEYLDLESAVSLASPLHFDALVAMATAPIGGAGDIPEALRGLLREKAQLFVAQPGADATLDFLLGWWAGWFGEPRTGEQGIASIPAESATIEAIERFGAQEVTSRRAADGLGALLAAEFAAPVIEPEQAAEAPSPEAGYLLIGGEDQAWGKALKDGALAQLPADADLAAALARVIAAGQLPAHIVYPVARTGMETLEALARHVEAIKAIGEALDAAGSTTRVQVCVRGGHDDDLHPSSVASGVWGFLRVAINEMPNVDFRLVEVASALDDGAARAAIESLLGYGGMELELFVDREGVSAYRMRRNLFPPAPIGAEERAVLRFEQAGRLDSFAWVKAPRRAPDDGEIEIEVAAVGLNFRDILVGLGILDDDLLGAGLTAAALGFECSGTVTRVGTGVTHLAPGDRVMGFAADTFASHLVSPGWHFFKVPEGVSLEAAATIPVAFATAWFALVKRAQIGPGDDVLIHGGAGAVGLAAIQFTKLAGARAIATASSDERRTIARAMGADLTYDSRQERFAEAIRNELGGVDVVLNSLAGAAMEASFRLVKPFGRFAELGKRDYLDNTQLGLRPFVRNIAYFGIDLDELLAHDRKLVEQMMQHISEQFARGELKPLPHRVFEAHEIGAAFRLMQASEHVGKIVIRPARLASRDASALEFKPRDGVHIVIGGTSGLGFASGAWLARKGAGTVVLASRRGRVEEGLESEIEALRASGARVLIEALDVSDAAAVQALVERLAREHGPVRGVIHAAVLLEDGMISSLEPDRLRAVLAPKLRGALNLDAACADQPLDYFVVYSSATTVIGSPGQGAYVAANAWLEGFARERRAQGKPALAIGWGAISDVGIIARDKQLGRRLRRTTGVVGISSTESLAHLGRLLASGNDVGPMQFYTNISPGAAAEKLRLINSAAFAGLGLARREDEGDQGGDLLSAIEGKSHPDAIALIVLALKREISHILRMAEDQIDTSRPLGELGLDSLMALELQLSIERLAGTDVPLVGASDRRLGDIAGLILSSLVPDGRSEDSDNNADTGLVMAVSGMHGGGEFSVEEAQAIGENLKVSGRKHG